MGPQPVIALFGPTAVGKTAIAIALAAQMRADAQHPVAVSADALAVYRGLEILTGAPTAQERSQLEHRLVSCVNLDQTFSVGEFATMAHAAIDALIAAGARPIVVGGTGLYLRAALCDLALRPAPSAAARARWSALLAERGPQAMHAMLAARAPALAERIDPGDRHRIVRALELHEIGVLDGGNRRERSQLWSDELRHPTRLIGLVMDRAELYARIDARVDRMVAAGVEAEVRSAAADASLTARKALGFQELLDGDVEAMKRRTRNYARRQLTWMRKLAAVELVDVSGRSPDEVVAALR
jgi:tRNA dimethylallyltransferase